MSKLDVPVRAPTGTAWIASAVLIIVAGEAVWEMRKETASVIFNVSFTDGQLLAIALVAGIAAVVSLTWLVSLFVAPGRLLVDGEAGLLRREERLHLKRAVAEGPLEQWNAKVLYFSDRQRADGVFKRIELSGPGRDEVLLFGDFRRGEEVARALEAAGERLGALTVEVEKNAPSEE